MSLSEAIKTELAKGTFTPVTLIKVQAKPSRGGDVMAYCLHTRNIDYDGDTYQAAPFTPSKLESTAGTDVNNATVQHLLGDMFTKLQVRGGKWAGARIELMCFNLKDFTMGPARRAVGRVGDVMLHSRDALTEFRGLMSLLNQDIGDRYSRNCRYKLGVFPCPVDINDFTDSGSVVGVTNQQRFLSSTLRPDNYFKYGRIVWTGGDNDGLEMETILNDGQEIFLFLPMPYEIQAGDTYDLIAGDDKTLATCYTRFDAALDHGGEDPMPKRDDVIRFPD